MSPFPQHSEKDNTPRDYTEYARANCYSMLSKYCVLLVQDSGHIRTDIVHGQELVYLCTYLKDKHSSDGGELLLIAVGARFVAHMLAYQIHHCVACLHHYIMPF